MILVTGGAGYIGGHVVQQLLRAGKKIVIIDNLSTGSMKNIQRLRDIGECIFIEKDLNDFTAVNDVLKEYDFKAIMHFAASLDVAESVMNPLKYYLNNTVNTANLIKCAIENGVQKFIFSSSAAVYGNTDNEDNRLVSEDHPTEPINPYGMSKLMSEVVLRDVAPVSKLKYAILRYFNVAGADMNFENQNLQPRMGIINPESTQLIQSAAKVACGIRDSLTIFGDNYDTFDGTCIRDYIHVEDLADCHILALDYIESNPSIVVNCGYGKGYSVKEVLDRMKKISGHNFSVDIAERRMGDPVMVVADNTLLTKSMGWVAKFDSLDTICESAYIWEKNGRTRM